MKAHLSIAALALTLALAGCPTDPVTSDAGPLTFPDCDAIIEACHEVDPGTGMASTCHDTAHDADSNDDCAPLREECVAACNMLDGGMHHDEDAGTSDAGEHTHDEDAGASDAGEHTHGEDAGNL